MCNEYDRLTQLAVLGGLEEFSRLGPARWAKGAIPNVGAQPGIKITDTAAIVRLRDGAAEFAMLPWSWKQNGRPVFNFRSEGRRFASSERCAILASAFYEFGDGKGSNGRKDKFRFTMPGHDHFYIAGIVKQGAFTMLTTAPGLDVAPIHARQIVTLRPEQALDWLELARPEPEILRPPPPGSLVYDQVR